MEGDPASDVFDLIVLGTGLAECLLAASAARAGKKVLHVDALDFYGGEAASFPLHQMHELAGDHAFSSGAAPLAGLDDGGVPARLQAYRPTPGERILPLDLTTFRPWNVRFHGRQPLPTGLGRSLRQTYIDLQPALTLSRGAMIDALVDSNVASYLEFVMMQAAYIVDARGAAAAAAAAGAASSSSSSSASWSLRGRVGGSAPMWQLRKLPCSKSDIFTIPTDYLSLLDKRRLQKFLQFALDLHTVTSDSGVPVVSTLNEHRLGTGRSLLRPQNKSTPSFDFDAWRGRPFVSFLKHCDLSPVLMDMMTYGVALSPGPQSEGTGTGGAATAAGAAATGGAAASASSAPAAASSWTAEEGMRRATTYLGALGRFSSSTVGTTACVMPKYGHGELPQAFTRACAVHGGIYMLRTPPAAYVFADAPASAADGGAAAAVATGGAAGGDASAAAEAVLQRYLDEMKQRGQQQRGGADDASAEAAPATTTSSSAASVPAPAADHPPVIDVTAVSGAPCVGIITTDGMRLRARRVASSAPYLPSSWYGSDALASGDAPSAGDRKASFAAGGVPVRFAIGSAVCLVSRGITPDNAFTVPAAVTTQAPAADDTAPTLLSCVIPPRVAPLGNPNTVFIVQQSAANACCPGDMTVVNAWTHVAAGDVPPDFTAAGTGNDLLREYAADVISRALRCLFPAAPTSAVDATSVAADAAAAPADATADANTASATATSALVDAAGAAAAPVAAAAETAALPLHPAVLWHQVWTTLTPDTSKVAGRLPPNWTVLNSQPVGGARLTNEHDVVEALAAFATACGNDAEFFGPPAHGNPSTVGADDEEDVDDPAARVTVPIDGDEGDVAAAAAAAAATTGTPEASAAADAGASVATAAAPPAVVEASAAPASDSGSSGAAAPASAPAVGAVDSGASATPATPGGGSGGADADDFDVDAALALLRADDD